MESEKDSFFERVYEVVRQIPSGRVTSYGAIAKALGAARSARMVGYAMNASHAIEDVPAHRVVNRKGMLTGKFHLAVDDQCRGAHDPVLHTRGDVLHLDHFGLLACLVQSLLHVVVELCALRAAAAENFDLHQTPPLSVG